MKDIVHASINGIEIHNLAEQDSSEKLLYSGELWMDGVRVGSFREGENDEMQLDVMAEYGEKVKEKISSTFRRSATATTTNPRKDCPTRFFWRISLNWSCTFRPTARA